MKSLSSVALFMGVWIIPVGLFLGLSLMGEKHPIEGRAIEQELFLKESKNELEVVFFGFAECSFICPKAMGKLAKVLSSIRSELPDHKFGGYFVDINASTQLERAHEYGQFFSEDIKGINVNPEELEVLKKEYSIRVLDTREQNLQLFHTDHFFVLQKEDGKWIIKRVLSDDIKVVQFNEILIQLLNGDIYD